MEFSTIEKSKEGSGVRIPPSTDGREEIAVKEFRRALMAATDLGLRALAIVLLHKVGGEFL
jgi:hypothetical protein